jgi:hypothetical protein
MAQLRPWIEECGLHCAGLSVPAHVCDPIEEPPAEAPHAGHTVATMPTTFEHRQPAKPFSRETVDRCHLSAAVEVYRSGSASKVLAQCREQK